jgi:hypothetical protein
MKVQATVYALQCTSKPIMLHTLDAPFVSDVEIKAMEKKEILGRTHKERFPIVQAFLKTS